MKLVRTIKKNNKNNKNNKKQQNLQCSNQILKNLKRNGDFSSQIRIAETL